MVALQQQEDWQCGLWAHVGTSLVQKHTILINSEIVQRESSLPAHESFSSMTDRRLRNEHGLVTSHFNSCFLMSNRYLGDCPRLQEIIRLSQFQYSQLALRLDDLCERMGKERLAMSSSESIEVIDADGVKENNFAVARELAETQALCRNVTNMT